MEGLEPGKRRIVQNWVRIKIYSKVPLIKWINKKVKLNVQGMMVGWMLLLALLTNEVLGRMGRGRGRRRNWSMNARNQNVINETFRPASRLAIISQIPFIQMMPFLYSFSFTFTFTISIRVSIFFSTSFN